jgi:hypothetical protein
MFSLQIAAVESGLSVVRQYGTSASLSRRITPRTGARELKVLVCKYVLEHNSKQMVRQLRFVRKSKQCSEICVMLDNGGFSLVKSYGTQLQSNLQFSSFQQMLPIIEP